MPVTTAFPQSQTASGVAIKVIYGGSGAAGSKYRPVRIVVLGQGNGGVSYSAAATKRIYTSSEAGGTYGYGSPIHLVAKVLFQLDGVGSIPVTVYPLPQPASGGAQAAGDITPSGTPSVAQTYYFRIGGVMSEPVVIPAGSDVAAMCDSGVAAINAVLDMPGVAADNTTAIGFTVGWEGTSGNNVGIEVIAPSDGEITWAITQPIGGTGTPDITAALALMGEEVWESHIINCLDYTDSAELAELKTFGDGRWTPGVRKPLVSFVGTNEPVMATVKAVTDARPTDRVNCVVPSPGSPNLPFVIATDHVRRIAVRANENPAYDYGSLNLDSLTPGTDAQQWIAAMRQDANVSGLSTTRVRDREVKISDVVTCWHPSTDEKTAYKKVVTIEKLATVIYNFNEEFDSKKWDSVPLIPTGQATTNPAAKTDSDAKAAMNVIFEKLALDAIISDPEWAKDNSSASIGGTNADRLDIKSVFKVSGNTNVISIDLVFSRHYGGAS